MKKILIIEDIEINVDLLTQLLQDEYEVIIADDGARGIALAEREKPNLILMDISLPGMDGYEATRRLKANGRLKHIPVIGLSAHAMSGDAEKARSAGLDDYLTKPLNDELLFAKLKAYLG